ncbi:Uncharacterised protein [Streptococcus pneumoniae]|nr:Uncharacterised protein [Streptococcus pneumoniae]
MKIFACLVSLIHDIIAAFFQYAQTPAICVHTYKIQETYSALYMHRLVLPPGTFLSPIPHTMKRLYHTLVPTAVTYKTRAQIIYVSLHLFLTDSEQTSLLHFVSRRHFAEV